MSEGNNRYYEFLFRGGRNLTRRGRCDLVPGREENLEPAQHYPLVDYVNQTVEEYVAGTGLADLIEQGINDQLPPLLSVTLGSTLAGTVAAEVASQVPPLIAQELLDFIPTVQLVACQEVNAKLPAAVTNEVAAQLPAAVTNELNTQLPTAVANELASQLPAAVSTAVTNEVATQLPAAVTSEVTAQLPGLVAPAVSMAISTQLPPAVDSAVDQAITDDVIPVIAPTVYTILDTYDFGTVTNAQLQAAIDDAVQNDILPVIAPTVYSILDVYPFPGGGGGVTLAQVQTEITNAFVAFDFTQDVCDVLDTKLAGEVAAQLVIQLPAAVVGPVNAAITAADIPGQVASAITAADIPAQVTTAVTNAVTAADIPGAVAAAITAADIPGQVSTAVTNADIPGQVSTAITTADIPGQVNSAITTADIPGQVAAAVVAADIPNEANIAIQTILSGIDFDALAAAAVAAIDITALVQAAIAAEDIPAQASAAVSSAVTAADIPGAVASAVTAADIPGQATTAVNNAVTAADIPGAVSTAITAADIPGAVATEITNADIPGQATTAVTNAVTAADIPGAVNTAITNADIPGQVSTAITAADIPGQATTAVNAAVTAADIPGQATTAVNSAVTAADIPGQATTAVTNAVAAADIPGTVATAITAADIPGQAASAVNAAITAADIPGTVASELTTQLPAAVVGPVNDYLAANLEDLVCDVFDDKLPAELAALVPVLVNPLISGAITTALDALKLPKLVTQTSDFPPAVGATIPLDPDTVYRICGDINLGALTLTGSNINLVGAEGGAQITSNSSAPLVDSDGTGDVIQIEGVRLVNTFSGPALRIRTTGALATRATIRNSILFSVNGSGVVVEDVDNFLLSNVLLFSDVGAEFTGTTQNVVIDGNRFGDGGVFVGQHTGMIIQPTASMEAIMVSNNIFRPSLGLQAFNISTAATYSDLICIADNNVIGDAFPVGNPAFMEANDPQIKAQANTGVPDTRYFGRAHFWNQNTSQNTTIAATPNRFGTGAGATHPTLALDPLSSNFSVVGATMETQALQCNAPDPHIYNVQLSASFEKTGGGASTYIFNLVKNGTVLTQAQTNIEVDTVEESMTMNVFLELGAGDQVWGVVAGGFGTTEVIRFTTVEITAFRID